MKRNLILLLLFCTVCIQAQNLDQFISKDCEAVVEVSGDQIFTLVSQTELEKLMMPASARQSGESMDLTEYGFDLNSKAYYFYQIVDSITYHNVVIKLSDVNKAEQLIKNQLSTPSTQLMGFEAIIESNMMAGWNNNMAVFSYADFPKKVYTIEDIIEEKNNEMLEQLEEEDMPVFEDLPVEEEMEMVEEEYNEEYDDEELFEDPDYGMDEESLEFELMIKNMTAPYIHSEDEMMGHLKNHFLAIINTKSSESVSGLKSYKKGRDKKSSAYFWMKNFDGMMKDRFMNEIPTFLPISSTPDMMFGINSVSGNLIFDKDEIKLSTKIEVNNSLVRAYKRMYDSKIDKSFLKYFDENDVLAYVSFSTNMQGVLEEYPNMAQKMYGSLAPDYREEMDIVSDLVSVILDEEAIGKLITGDGMMLLHDLEEKEITYKTYEFDEDYNATEVEKVKTEQIPTFTIMMGSENEKMIAKLMKLGTKYQASEKQGGYHRILAKSMGGPFDIYFAHNDDIAFITNSLDRVIKYVQGKKACNLGRHKKILKNNLFALYFNSNRSLEKLTDIFPMDKTITDYVKDNFTEMYFTMGRMKGSQFGYDMVIKTNKDHGNSLKLLLSSFKEFQSFMEDSRNESL